MALNVWQKKNKRIDHHLQVPNRIIQIADDIALKLLNGIVRFCEAQFLHLHFMDKRRAGTRAIAAFIAACRFA